MPSNCLAERLGDLIDLDTTECHLLNTLTNREREIPRGTVLVRENDPANEMFLLKSGTMMSYVLLDDGSRQILRFLYPGDLLSTTSLAYPTASETVSALSPCVVCPFDRAAVARLIAAAPRLAGVLLAYSQIERTALTDRLAGLGRTSALARVSALLLDVSSRRRGRGDDDPAGFVLGLTQEEVGDATGLTSVHVNRMFRELETRGHVARKAGRILIRDEAELTRVANYTDRYRDIDLSWLPEVA